MISLEKHALIITLVMQFWISGLFVLSVIFTQNQQLDDLTLFTFIAYAVLICLFLQIGSFFAGILSDIYGRKPIFLVSTALLTIAAAVLLFYPFYGYVLANLAIGPLNNLTFVFINQVHPQKSQQYTIFVLIGWAFSEITLGCFFLLSTVNIFMYSLLAVTLLYMILAFLYVKETKDFLKTQSDLQTLTQIQIFSSNNLSNNPNINQQTNSSLLTKIKTFITQKIFPTTLKPLIGGSILMFMMQMFYYRTQFTLDTFGVSLQINTIVVGCTQVFANLLFTKMLQSMKRNLALKSLIISLMGLLLFLIFSQQSWVQTIVQGFMRFVDTAIMIVLGVYIPQLFPSNQRGRGTNLIMSFGVIGSALNGKLFSHLPFWSLEIFLLAALATTLLLKQTNVRKQDKSSSSQSITNQTLSDQLIGSQQNANENIQNS